MGLSRRPIIFVHQITTMCDHADWQSNLPQKNRQTKKRCSALKRYLRVAYYMIYTKLSYLFGRRMGIRKYAEEQPYQLNILINEKPLSLRSVLARRRQKINIKRP